MTALTAFIAGAQHAAEDRKLFDARAFWVGSVAIRNLIREGRLNEAAAILSQMRKSAKFLGPGSALGSRMLADSQELFYRLVETRDHMCGDMARAAR